MNILALGGTLLGRGGVSYGLLAQEGGEGVPAFTPIRLVEGYGRDIFLQPVVLAGPRAAVFYPEHAGLARFFLPPIQAAGFLSPTVVLLASQGAPSQGYRAPVFVVSSESPETTLLAPARPPQATATRAPVLSRRAPGPVARVVKKG